MPRPNDVQYAQPQDFWQNYSRGRPQVPQSFWDRIFQYHTSQGGTFGMVHDVGAGAGTHSAQLAKKFEHVIVSDVAAPNIEIARKELVNDAAKFTSRPGTKVEDSDQGMEPGSVDMVFAANVIHFTDLDASMRAIATQLKPGTGTLIMALFGKHRIDDEEVSACWQEFWDRGSTIAIRDSKVSRDEGLMRTFRRLESAYDCIPLDREQFKDGILRIRSNMPKSGLRFIAEEFDGQYVLPSYIGAQDEIFEEEDHDWDFEWGIEEFRASFNSFLFMSKVPEQFEDLWQDMERLLANGRKVKGTWTVWYVFATRRE